MLIHTIHNKFLPKNQISIHSRSLTFLSIPLLLVITSFGFLLHKLYGVLAPYRDSGDLVAAAYSLGIAHPPGYGFYTIITKIGMLLFPFGNVAYRANFLSALWTSLAIGIFYCALRKFVRPASAVVALLIWIVSPAVIQLSIVSEMYSLNALLCSLVVFCLAHAISVKRDGHEGLTIQTVLFTLAFYIVGLGLNNQPTLVLILPGLLFYTWNLNHRVSNLFSLKQIAMVFIFGLIGFSLVFYYPIRSFQEPWID